MATWEDGPEYAPVERPSAFTEVPGTPLGVAPARERPAPAPDARPRFDEQAGVRPLAEHHPPPGPTRDPHEPYALARSALTVFDEAPSAWDAAHHHPVPGTPPPQPKAPAEPAIGAGGLLEAMTPPTLITLLIGGLAMAVPAFGWLSPLMFVVAFMTASRIASGRRWVRIAFLVGSGALGTTVVAGLFLSLGDLTSLLQLIYGVSTVTCWLVLLAVCLIVRQALIVERRELDPGPGAYGPM